MNSVLYLLFIFCLPTALTAQVSYESDYVSNGKTFSIDLPSGYKSLGGDDAGMEFYSRDKNASLSSQEPPEKNAVILAMMPFNFGLALDSESADVVIGELMGEFITSETIVESRDKTTKDGQYFRIGSAMTEPDEDIGDPVLMNVGLTLFEEVLFIVYWFDFEGSQDDSEFNSMIDSYKVFATDKENGFDIELYEEELDYEESNHEGYYDENIEDVFFINNLYDSKFKYEMIFFEVEIQGDLDYPTWEEDWEREYPELMIAYIYNRYGEDETFVEGGVKVFSGGAQSNYTTEPSKLDAVQNVFEEYDITNLSNKRTITRGDNRFDKYDLSYIKGDSDKPSVLYTLNYGGETFFFLVYETPDVSTEFISAAEDFITSFIVIE